MIAGRVHHNKIYVELRVHGSEGREITVEAKVDTGYTGDLTLPSEIVSQLKLKWERSNAIFLADDSPRIVDEFEAYVEWDDQLRKLTVDQIDSTPLIGMSLLYNHELKVQIHPAGKVQIKRLRRT